MTDSTDTAFSAFLSRHRILLAKEREAEIERSSLLFSNCGPRLLEQKGLSLGNLAVANVNIGLGGKTLVELEQPAAYNSTSIFPPHTLRPGDLARIEAHVASNSAVKKSKKTGTAESAKSQVEGVVYKVSDTRIVVAISANESGASEELDLPERCRVLKLANSVTYDRMEKALDRLEAAATGKSGPPMTDLIRVLLGMMAPSERTPISGIDFFDKNLNDSQKEAIQFCLESPEVACIHGPPGTGKTHTLIELIRQMTTKSAYNPKPLRLLVCGASNLSVDNILERLLSLPSAPKGQELRVTRVGHPARVMSRASILEATLEVQSARSDQAELTKDVKAELEDTLRTLSGKGKDKAPRGSERRKMWDDVKALRKEYRQRERGIVVSVLKHAQVVLATCHTAGSRQLFSQDFDVVIIDEATQAMEAVCWIPIFKGKKLILAGDPKQLPPTILSLDKMRKEKQTKGAKKKVAKGKAKNEEPLPSSSDDSIPEADEVHPKPQTSLSRRTPLRLMPPRTLETTLFDRLGPGVRKMLKVQYRMNRKICEFPSEEMYEGKLTSDPSVAEHLLKDLPNAAEDEDDILISPVVFFDTAGMEYFERVEGDGDEGSRCNENEATIVKNWVDQLLLAGVGVDQISIITPYQAQVTLLSSLLRPIHGNVLEIGTVDGMQGREKEAVIISLVRSNDKREVGFLKDKRRLNVAMTRAKRQLCIIGDSSTITHGGKYLKDWLAWLERQDVRYAGLD